MKIIKCESLFSRLKGLMFSKKLKDSALLFVFQKETKISLHMFFVFYPIDVAFLNENMKVVDLKQKFKPFTIYISKKPAKYVLEMPLGSIKKIDNKVDFSKL